MTAKHRAPRNGRGALGVAIRLAISVLLTLIAGSLMSPVDAKAVPGDSSSVTVNGTGEFADLRVTVAQTDNLINQVVHVSWTGGTQTAPTTGSFNTNFLQIMQCWGDDTGPKREQCQFGALYGDQRGAPTASSRQSSYGAALVDPLETYKQAPGSFFPAYVPFESVTGKTVTGTANEFFDGYSTNEVPFARTGADGAGEEFFEVQTAREAPGLGCGERMGDGTGRSCWLVVVPRGATEVNGAPVTDTPFKMITSSPLSATNWNSHLAVRLKFQPIGLACPIGTAERRTIGQEPIAEAIYRWQPALCQTGSIFGFSQISDDLARRQITTADNPALAFVSQPASEAKDVVYAPVALSGLTVAFNLEIQPSRDAPPEVKARSGERITSLRLTPRLVAKLLTHSYKLATLAAPAAIADNPMDLTRDPDFLSANPAFRDYTFNGVPVVVTPFGLSDSAAQLWTWLHADTEAAAFLSGKADPYGMVVNPYYKNLDVPRSDYPRSDPGCQAFGDGRPDLCALDAFAYASDLHEAARGAARGDTLQRNLWDPTAAPPSWKKSPPQLSGARAVIVLADAASAARFSLPTAELRNAAGQWTRADAPGLLAGVAGARTTAGIAVPDPTAKAAAAYPLTTLTYAATTPGRLTTEDAKAYAAFVRYAVTDGQVPGTDAGELSPGYVPLPGAQRAVAQAAAKRIADRWAPPAATAAPAVPEPLAPASAGAAGEPAPIAPLVPRSVVPGGAQLPATQAPVRSTAPVQPVVAVTPGKTPAVPVGPVRLTVAGALLLGAAASGAGPLLRRRA